MAFPRGYGFYGSCLFCPRNKDCDEGRHCKIFSTKAHSDKLNKPRTPRYLVKTDKENYTLSDLLLRGAVWCMRLLGLASICYFIYDRTK